MAWRDGEAGEVKPSLVFVHGIGGQRNPDTELRAWLEALALGARNAGHSREALALVGKGSTDTAFAYYGDLFASRQAQGASLEGIEPAEARTLQKLLEDLIDAQLAVQSGDGKRRVLEHARTELTPTRQPQGAGDLGRRLVNVCTTLLALPGVRRAGQWASGQLMAGHLAQVVRYLGRVEPDDSGSTLDQRIRSRLLGQLDEARPTVVVAHSLGSVVAMEALHHHGGYIPLLVTVGSPIGMRTVVQPRLRPQPLVTPGCVGRWLNYWDRDDIIASRPLLERDVLPNAAGCQPVSHRVDSDGVWVHTATKYLAQASVAGSVVEAVRLVGESESA